MMRAESLTTTRAPLAAIWLLGAGFFTFSGPASLSGLGPQRQLIVGGILLLLYLAIYSNRAFLSVRPQKDHSMVWARRSIAALLLLMFASALWSEESSTVFLASLLGLLAVIFGLVSGRSFGAETLPRVLMISGFLAGVLSIALMVIEPGSALVEGSYQTGTLKGIYTHRNHLGFVVSISSVASLSLIVLRRKQLFWPLFNLVFSLYVLFRTASATSLAVTMLSVFVVLGMSVFFMFSVRGRGLATLGALAPASLMFLVFALGSDSVLSVLGRDDTFTGRTAIWPQVLDYALQSIWFGTGWGSTWTESSAAQQQISRSVGFRVHHSHNTYLDVLLQLGVIGVALVAILCIALTWAVLARCMRTAHGDLTGLMALGVLFVLLMSSVMEFRLLHPYGLALLGGVIGGLGSRPLLSARSALNLRNSLEGSSTT